MDSQRSITFVNTNLPVDNNSLTFIIPPNTPDYMVAINTKIPSYKHYYRHISEVTYRVDTSGIYNIPSTQTVVYKTFDNAVISLSFDTGFYTVHDFNTLFSVFMKPIALSGPYAYVAYAADTVKSINLSKAPYIQTMLRWPAIYEPVSFTPTLPVDITAGYDMMVVYASIVRQSTENNRTNLIAIPITSDANGLLGKVISNTKDIITPLLDGMDTIASVAIRLRTYDDKPYLINTPVFLNFKLSFAERR